MEPSNDLPFAGVRVADFSWVIAGPASTQWLANLGAEVILVESPTHQSVHRVINWGGMVGDMSDPYAAHGGFNSINYGKLGCLLDIATPSGRELADRLIGISDIVVTAYTRRVLERFRLTYEDLTKVNPGVIALSVSSFGTSGPMRDVAGYGPTVQSYAGIANLIGYEGTEGGLRLGGFYPDYTVAMQSAYLLSAALYRKRRTGQGAHLDVALIESALAMVPQELMDVQMNHRVAGPAGNSDPLAVPHEVYRCDGKDRWVAVAVYDQIQWQAFCHASGHSEWAADPRFADAAARHRHRQELDDSISEWTASQDAEAFVELLQSAGVPAALSATALDMVSDPQLHDRGAFFELADPVAGDRMALSLPVSFSDVGERRTSAAPSPGRDNEYVYRTLLGMSEAEYDSLKESGVIG